MNAADRPSAALSQFVAGTRFADLPASTVRSARRALLDALGVTLAASRIGEGCAAFIELAREQGGVAESTVIGSGGMRVPAAMAAFANGSMAHALDFEDSHDGALVHPNAATVPAALAVAESLGAVSGERTLTALVVGCELVCRLGLALRVPLDDYGWYPPPILGAFGATAAAASLYGLDARQVRDAFSLTLWQATASAEIKHSPESPIRGVRDAFAAKAGVLSARLAGKGIAGFDRPFEGEAGFFACFARGEYAPPALTDGLGDAFEIEQLSFKPWPSCRGTHVFIEAGLALMREHAFAPGEVVEIEVRGNRINRMLAEPVESKCRPATAIDAKFSIPFTVASAVVHGGVALDHFAADALRNPRVLALARRVHYDVEPALGTTPADMTRGSIAIRTGDGREFSRRLDRAHGHPSRPSSDAVLEEKFRDCAGRAAVEMTGARIARIVETVRRLDRIEDTGRELMALL